MSITRRLTSLSLSFLCILFLFSGISARLHASDALASIQETEVARLAKLLADEAVDAGMLDDVCRLYLADREGVIETFVAEHSFVALSDAMSGQLNKTRPGSGCEVSIMKTSGQLSREQISSYVQTMDQPGSMFALSFFPSRFGVMMFANGYRPDGRSAVFTDRIDVAIETANGLDSSDRDGLGGPALPVRQNNQTDQSQSPPDEGDDEVRLEKSEKPFLDQLRERAGTERAE